MGLMRKSNEYKLGTSEGIVKARTIRRLPPGQRADADGFSKLVGTPWKPVPGAVEGDVEIREAVVRVEAPPVVSASQAIVCRMDSAAARVDELAGISPWICNANPTALKRHATNRSAICSAAATLVPARQVKR